MKDTTKECSMKTSIDCFDTLELILCESLLAGPPHAIVNSIANIENGRHAKYASREICNHVQ